MQTATTNLSRRGRLQLQIAAPRPRVPAMRNPVKAVQEVVRPNGQAFERREEGFNCPVGRLLKFSGRRT